MNTQLQSNPLTIEDADWLLSASDSELEQLLTEQSPQIRESILSQLEQHQTAAERVAARATETPATLAVTVSRGRWMTVRHLDHLDLKVTTAINRGGGRLIVAMPPRHGKSEYCSKYLPAWFVGKWPNKRVMLGSYEADFASQWGRRARNVLEEFGSLFSVAVSSDSSAANRWGVQGHDGGMQTAGVGGPFTGKGADLLIIDDPIKGFEEAASQTIRDKTWEWWLQNAYTRLEPRATAIIVATRWHEDDLTGRVLELTKDGGEQWEVIRFPAIAEESDALGRQPGEPLWEARYPVAELERIRSTLGPHRFGALYQQNPMPPEGGMFKRDWFEIVDAGPFAFDSLVRAWDFAGTEDDGDWTAGVLIGQRDLDLYVIDVVRGQWGSGTRDERVFATACEDEERYGGKVQVWFPQDPGQAGKGQAEGLALKLRGYRVKYEPVSGDKATRADPLAAACWAGWKAGTEKRVKVVRGPWNRAFIDELCTFPNGKHDDQVDAAALAFVKLVKPKKRVLVA